MKFRAPWACLLLLGGCLEDPVAYDAPDREPARLAFVEWTAKSGLLAKHQWNQATVESFRASATPDEAALLPLASGMAVGDVDSDGWTDLLVLTGEGGAALFHNQEDGTFEDVTESFELDIDALASGPLLADFDGDGYVDLLVGGIGEEHVRLFRNDQGKRFVDITERSRLRSDAKVLAVSAGDADGDGDLDVLLARPGARATGRARQRFWLNDGDARFSDASSAFELPGAALRAADESPDAGVSDAGVSVEGAGSLELLLSAAFADLDRDGAQDLTLVQDLGQSAVVANAGNDGGVPTFAPAVLVGGALGRGSALGDYDNDGDLDWFVSGIDAEGLPEFAAGDGNHLFENQGDGSFRDVTARAHVGDGSFAWGACFADFDNDGFLDLFQVNGWGHLAEGPDAGSLRHDASRLFHNRGDGSFEEVAIDVGLVDEGEGRAVACFDYDHDGDVDIAVTNADGEVAFYGNTLNPWYTAGANYLCVALQEDDPSRTTIGARVAITTDGVVQTRFKLLGSYLSPVSNELHFGVGGEEMIDRVDIQWTDGDTGRISNWSANNCLVATHLPPSH